MTPPTLDLDLLLKLRVAVARFGEMDLAGWWNTTGQLGKYGAVALRRGLPRTHYFAQARSVFAVAEARCREVFFPPNCVNLFHLPEPLEEEFDARWESWLDDAASWTAFFERVAAMQNGNLVEILQALELVGGSDVEGYGRLRRSADKHAVALSAPFSSTNADVRLLALGFARGEHRELAVPYARRSDV